MKDYDLGYKDGLAEGHQEGYELGLKQGGRGNINATTKKILGDWFMTGWGKGYQYAKIEKEE